MKNYYKGPLKRAVATNPTKKEGSRNYQYDIKTEIIKEDVLFHRNIMNVLIKSDDKIPIFLENELDDLFQFNFQNGSKACMLDYVDLQDLEKTDENIKQKSLVKSIKDRFKR